LISGSFRVIPALGWVTSRWVVAFRFRRPLGSAHGGSPPRLRSGRPGSCTDRPPSKKACRHPLDAPRAGVERPQDEISSWISHSEWSCCCPHMRASGARVALYAGLIPWGTFPQGNRLIFVRVWCVQGAAWVLTCLDEQNWPTRWGVPAADVFIA
jgi:hypothetical protein